MKKNNVMVIVTMLLCIFDLQCAYAASSIAKVDGWELMYTVSKENAIITGTAKEGTNPYTLIIPEEIDGYRVTHIEENALRKTQLARISLPDGIEHLDVRMPEELSSVTFPSNLKTIGEDVFKYTKLKQVKLPKTVTSIGRSAFEGCESLTKAVLPDGLEFLGPDAFRGCKNLEEINIPDGIKWSLDNSFEGCKKIRKVNYNGEMTANMAASLKDTRFMRDYKSEHKESYEDDEDTVKSSYDGEGIKHIISVSNNGGEVAISVNGRNVMFTDAKPFIDANNRTQAPLRRIASRTGCRVSYDAETGEITLSKQDLSVKLRIGSVQVECNGKTIEMDTEAIIVNDRTFIPVRYLAEAIGYDIEYN